MATYDFFKTQATPSGNPTAGKSMLLRADVDFNLHRQQGWTAIAATDVIRVIRLKDHWILKNAWYRVHTASTDSSTRTVDIGTADNGTEIASNVDMKTAGDWVQGTIGKDSAGTSGVHVIQGADGHIFVSPDHAFTSGKLQIMVEVVAAPGSEDGSY